MTKRICIFVLGMHRSGTSAVTGLLQMMGVDLGDDLMPPWPDNEKGFFENNKIWNYNQQLLESFNSSWDDPFLTQNWCAVYDLSDFKQPIKELIEAQFGSSNLFAIKDPRLCILFPLWKETLAEMGIESVCVLPVRHPLEVAKSLRKRNKFSLEKGFLLWLNHVLSAEMLSRGCARLYIGFDDLFSKPGEVLVSVQKNLSLNFPKALEGAEEQIRSFLDKDLKHHTESVLGKSRMDEILAELYDLFRQAASDKKEDPDWQRKLDAIRAEYQQLYQFFMVEDLSQLAGYPRELEQKNNELVVLGEALIMRQNENSQLQKENESLIEKTSSLQKELEAMRNTKVWQMAEVLRRTLSGRKG